MKHLEKAIVLNVALPAVYERWMRFEEFPEFMRCVHSVRQLENRRSEWRLSLWGRKISWVAELHELVPEQSIAWRSVAGRALSGNAGFDRIGENKTKLTIRMHYDLEGPLEWICDELLGAVGSHVAACLSQFRGLLERDTDPALSPVAAELTVVGTGTSKT